MPWWERISVTVDDSGTQQSCKVQSSLSLNGPQACDEETAAAVRSSTPKSTAGLYSKLTFERRFSPDGKLDSGRLHPGDELLGRQVMFLTIDSAGAITSCRIIAKSGPMSPTYGCEDAKSEQFRVPASVSVGTERQAFMTILAYGHQEQIV